MAPLAEMTANGQDEALLDTGPSLQDAFKQFRMRKRQQQRQVPTKELRAKAAERRAKDPTGDKARLRALVAAAKSSGAAALLLVDANRREPAKIPHEADFPVVSAGASAAHVLANQHARNAAPSTTITTAELKAPEDVALRGVAGVQNALPRDELLAPLARPPRAARALVRGQRRGAGVPGGGFGAAREAVLDERRVGERVRPGDVVPRHELLELPGVEGRAELAREPEGDELGHGQRGRRGPERVAMSMWTTAPSPSARSRLSRWRSPRPTT